MKGSSTLSTEGLIVDTIRRTFSSKTDQVDTVVGEFEALLELVRATMTAIRNDVELSETIISNVDDLDLLLIQYLCFDNDGIDPSTDSDHEIQGSLDKTVAKVLWPSVNKFLNEHSIKDADNHDLAGVLSDNLRKNWDQGLITFLGPIQNLARRGKFAITVDGRLCLMVCDVQVGDKIGIIKGTKAPYVLREDGDGFICVGVTYIRGWMHGEALDDERYTVQEILIH